MLNMKRVLALDPGNSTGWVFRDEEGVLCAGGTVYENFTKIYNLIASYGVDAVVYETFNLYAGAAKHMVNNDFYPCQVIGVIKLAAMREEVKYLVPLSPGLKKYSGGLDTRWSNFRAGLFSDEAEGITEHTKDAYLLLRYYERFVEESASRLAKSHTPKVM